VFTSESMADKNTMRLRGFCVYGNTFNVFSSKVIALVQGEIDAATRDVAASHP
jgi:hypothetical protein